MTRLEKAILAVVAAGLGPVALLHPVELAWALYIVGVGAGFIGAAWWLASKLDTPPRPPRLIAAVVLASHAGVARAGHLGWPAFGLQDLLMRRLAWFFAVLALLAVLVVLAVDGLRARARRRRPRPRSEL